MACAIEHAEFVKRASAAQMNSRKAHIETSVHKPARNQALVPGEPGTENEVGPSLRGIGSRSYIVGVLLNTPENMARWLCDPQAISPHSAMPNLGLSPQNARDIADVLMQLK